MSATALEYASERREAPAMQEQEELSGEPGQPLPEQEPLPGPDPEQGTTPGC
jgi:hypothetical protein